MMVKGDVFWEWYGKGHRGNVKSHVYFIDDEIVVIKFWQKHRKRWEYRLEIRWLFDLCFKEDRPNEGYYTAKRPY